jgi:hypothetical protein
VTFWAAIPVFRHNWIDEDALEEDLEADEGEGPVSDAGSAAVRDL